MSTNVVPAAQPEPPLQFTPEQVARACSFIESRLRSKLRRQLDERPAEAVNDA